MICFEVDMRIMKPMIDAIALKKATGAVALAVV